MVSELIAESAPATPSPTPTIWSPDGMPAAAATMPPPAAQRCIPNTQGGVATSKAPVATGDSVPLPRSAW